jgi:hypothetical protein
VALGIKHAATHRPWWATNCTMERLMRRNRRSYRGGSARGFRSLIAWERESVHRLRESPGGTTIGRGDCGW